MPAQIQQGNNPHMIQVNLGTVEALLPPPEQVPGEKYIHGNRIRAYVIDVHRGTKGPSITLSRSHPDLVRKLFELEVPEIADGAVEIVALAREAGHRTKIAVKANTPGINAKGACIGEMGSRVRAVMTELNDEKIDIVDYNEDPANVHRQRAVAVAGEFGHHRRCGDPLGPRRGSRLPALPGHRQGRAECPPRRQAHRLAHRHRLGRRRPAKARPPFWARPRAAPTAVPAGSGPDGPEGLE